MSAIENSLIRTSGVAVTDRAWNRCTVVIKPEAHCVIPLLQVSSLANGDNEWWHVAEVRFEVHWDQAGKEKSTQTVYFCISEEERNKQFDSLRREAFARRHYESRSVFAKKFMQAYPAPIKQSLQVVSASLIRKEELRHPRGRCANTETVWLVAGRKEPFLKEEEAVIAARAELEALLLHFGTNFYANAFAAEAREVLPTVMAELPANFQATARETLPYLAELMEDGVAARIAARGLTPTRPKTWH